MQELSNRQPRVLITGASGHVARHVIPMLRQRYDLILTDIETTPDSTLPIIAADLRRREEVQPLMDDIDAVVHLAIASPVVLEQMPEAQRDDEVMAVNVIGTQHVFDAARLAGVRKVVFMSSMTVMLGEPQRPAFDDQTPPQPNGLYACTKLFGEWLGEWYAREHNLRVICIRLGQPYPYGYPSEHDELADASFRGMKIGHRDIAQAIQCALDDNTLPYRIISVTSASDHAFVDLSSARAIGYEPRQYFTADGMSDLPERAVNQPQHQR